jgi:hypothetical protein
MKPFRALPLLLLAACASPPPQRALDVSATRLSDQTAFVEARLVGAGGEVLLFPRVLLDADDGRALIHVGEQPEDPRSSDGVHASIVTDADGVLVQAWGVELGRETWRCERRAPHAAGIPETALPRRRGSDTGR